MMTTKLTSLLLTGLLCVAATASFAAPYDSPHPADTRPGVTRGSTLSPDYTRSVPSAGNNSGSVSGTGTNGGASGSGSGAGGGTGAAGGGTGGAGGGTGSWTNKSKP